MCRAVQAKTLHCMKVRAAREDCHKRWRIHTSRAVFFERIGV